VTANDKRLVLAHLWLSFALFVCALFLGFWQFWFRSPIPPGFGTPTEYYISVTAHGTIIAFAFTTLFAMGFGYAVTALTTRTALRWRTGAWLALALTCIGLALLLVAIISGRATVLYTFYPPLVASFAFYFGLTLVVVGSWFWVAHMIASFRAWKTAHPGQTTPLGLFMTTATALLWMWTSIGASVELLFELIPLSLGWIDRIDLGLARTLFSWTLHGIVYFWLLPAYMALYLIVPEEAGGRLYSDPMARLAFVLFLIFGLPVGLHHLFMDPEHGSAFKFVQGVFTVFVALGPVQEFLNRGTGRGFPV
jgi:cytochrome c oxidase subunit 1